MQGFKNLIFYNVLSFILLYDGGCIGIVLKLIDISVHSFQLISALGLNILFFLSKRLYYLKAYKRNLKILVVFGLFTLIYFFQTSFDNEYSIYKMELILFYYSQVLFLIPVIYSNRKIRLVLIYVLINILIRILYNYYYPQEVEFLLEEDIQRLTFGEPIIYSRLIGFGVLICLFFLNKFKLILIPILIFALTIISTRAILFSTIGLVLFYVFRTNKKLSNAFKFISFLISSFFVYILIEKYFNLLLKTRLVSLDGGGRLKMLEDSFLIFANNPIFGSGVASFSFNQSNVSNFNRIYPHNIILELLSENGIIGFVLFTILIGIVIKSIQQNYNTVIRKFLLYFAFYSLVTSMFSLDLPNQFLIFNLIVLATFCNNISDESFISR